MYNSELPREGGDARLSLSFSVVQPSPAKRLNSHTVWITHEHEERERNMRRESYPDFEILAVVLVNLVFAN